MARLFGRQLRCLVALMLGVALAVGFVLGMEARDALADTGRTVGTQDNGNAGSRTSVSYIKADGTEGTAECTVLQGGTGETLSAGYYVVNSDVEYSGPIILDGDVTLIVEDGCTLTFTLDTSAEKPCIAGAYNAAGNLTVYGQANQTGKIVTSSCGYYQIGVANLTVNGAELEATALGIDCSTFSMSGGKVSAMVRTSGPLSISGGACYGALRSGGALNISGGSFTFESQVKNPGIFSAGDITITGGVVKIYCSYDGYHAIQCGGDITILGGQVRAEAKPGYGIQLVTTSQTITLGWAETTDYVYASGYYSNLPVSDSGNTIKIVDGQSMTDGEHTYDSATSADTLWSLKDKRLRSLHSHEFSCVASGDTITVTCTNTGEGCILNTNPSTLTIVAPKAPVAYDGTQKAATVVGKDSFEGTIEWSVHPITYKCLSSADQTESADAPSDAGTYQASVTTTNGVEAFTASVTYTIAEAELTGVSVSQDGTLTYTGEAQTPKVTTAATAVNDQPVTFTYSRTQDGEYGDMPTVTDVADGGTFYYKASAPNHEDATGSFTVTVNKANQETPAAPTEASVTTNSVTLTPTDGYQYKCGDGTWQDSNVFAGLDMNTAYDFYQRVKGDDNHNPSDASPATRIKTNNHVHDWSYAADGAVITATCGNTDGGHEGGTTSTITIVAPAHDTYGDGKRAEATLTGTSGFNEATGLSVSASDIKYYSGETELASAPVDAGEYAATITAGGATASVSYTIAKADPKYTSRPEAVDGLEDTGEAQDLIQANTGTTDDGAIWYAVKNVPTSSELTGVTEPSRDDASWSTEKPTGTNAGYYAIFYYIKGEEPNYNDSETSWLLEVIQPSADTPGRVPKDKLPTVNNGLVYNGTEQALMTTPTDVPASITYKYCIKEKSSETPTDSEFTPGDPTATNAGTYYVWFTAEEGDGQLIFQNVGPIPVTISPKSIEGATVILGDTTYTGSSQDASVISVTLEDGTVLGLSGYELSGDTSATDAGTYTVYVTGKGNYEGVVAAEWSITQATPTITVVPTASVITYGQTLADSTLTGGMAKLGDEEVPGTFAWADSGTIPSVSNSGYDVVFTPADTSNYTECECTVMPTVEKAALTITVKDQSIYVGDTVPTLEGEDFYTVTGLVGEDQLTSPPTLAYQKNGSAVQPDNSKEGTYDIVASDAEAGGNYAISYEDGVLRVEKKEEGTATKYAATSGADATWVKDSEDGLSITFKRIVEGETQDTTFEHFKSASVDGVTLTEGDDYTAKAGSVVVTLTPAFLSTLAAGEHTLTVTFDDGAADAKFTVTEASTPETEKAADKTQNGSSGAGKNASDSTGSGAGGTSSTTTTGSTGSGMSGVSDTATTTGSVASKGDATAKTGDATSVTLVVSIALAGAVALVAGRRRRR